MLLLRASLLLVLQHCVCVAEIGQGPAKADSRTWLAGSRASPAARRQPLWVSTCSHTVSHGASVPARADVLHPNEGFEPGNVPATFPVTDCSSPNGDETTGPSSCRLVHPPSPTHTHCFGVELSAFWFPSGSYYLEADLNLECHTGTLHLSSLIDQWAVSSVCRSVAVHLPGRAHVPGPLPQTPPGKLSLPPERASGNAGRSSRLYQHDCVQVIISLQ